MKKLLLLTFALSLFACDGGDDNGTNPTSIEGRWNLSSQNYNGVAENLSSCDLESYMQLSSNGLGTYYIYYTDFPDNPEIEPCGLDSTFDVISTYMSGISFTMTWDYGDGDNEVGEAVINENILTFTSVYEGVNYVTTFTKD
jgi:hypothetical protein